MVIEIAVVDKGICWEAIFQDYSNQHSYKVLASSLEAFQAYALMSMLANSSIVRGMDFLEHERFFNPQLDALMEALIGEHIYM